MSNNQFPNPVPVSSSGDDQYLKIWEVEQRHEDHRWTITTFFFGISFGAASFSFQNDLSQSSVEALRIGAVLIYCFGFFFFRRLTVATRVLRDYLHEMEGAGETKLSIQSQYHAARSRNRLAKVSTGHILFGVGVLYAGALAFISWTERLAASLG